MSVQRAPATEDFEKWIRMASDNKINTTNSWDLALIDYFYDLSLLRENDGINFQKASTTLDGCVKIYSSRVDSAAAETGKLLNGLAANSGSQEEAEEGEEDEEELDVNTQIKKRKHKSNSNKNTLVEFDAIKIKKMEMEIHVDPLFKKVLTDFDEGGSKSLLINMLGVDENQKIIFDTTEAGSEPVQKRRNSILEQETEYHDVDMVEHSFSEMDIDEEEDENSSNDTLVGNDSKTIDVNYLAAKYFDNCDFNSLAVCPSVNDLLSVLNQETTPTSILQNLEKINLENYYSQNIEGNGDYDYDISFGGQEYNGPQNEDVNDSKYPGNKSSIFFNDLEDDSDHYGNTIRELFNEGKSFSAIHETINEEQEEEFQGNVTSIPDENLLAYFDQNLRNNWAGPDHWRVKKLKAMMNINNNEKSDELNNNDEPKTKKKSRQPFIIDFISEENYPDESIIFETSNTISLPKKEIKSKDTHILPIDLHFTTRNFIYLFQKDKLINSMFKKVKNLDDVIDESLFANLNKEEEININNPDFYNDDNNDNISFGGGYEDDYVPADSQQPTQLSQIPSKYTQSNAINYSRVSKKVDIKLLKDNIWDTLNSEISTRKSIINTESSITSSNNLSQDGNLKFSDIVHDVTSKYDQNTKKDLSTSFCFICLLHLANENGFTIENTTDNKDLLINSVPE